MEQSRILIVDDEPFVLQALQRSLRNHFEVVATGSPEEALELLADGEFAVIVADQFMPVMEGTQLLEKAREIAPQVLRIMLTGRADVDVAVEAINRGAVYRFLTKPWNTVELLSVLRQAAQHYWLEQENRRLHILTQEQSARLEEFNQVLTKKVFVRTRELAEETRTHSVRSASTLDMLAGLAEAHGPVLGGHAKRVTALALAVGKRMKLKKEKLAQLELAAMLHDVGKIGMDARVIAARGLSGNATAKAVYQSHPAAGATLVRQIPDSEEAALYVRHHHEHFDGTGYPNRFRGNDIPLGARIIAVADAYDWALNGRETFDTITPEEALEQVRELSMRVFDPEVVNVLSYCVLTEPEVVTWEKEIEIPQASVQPGMVVARNVHAPNGSLLIAEGAVVEEWHLTQLARASEDHAVPINVHVRRKSIPSCAA